MKQSDIYRNKNTVVPDNRTQETDFEANELHERRQTFRQMIVLKQVIDQIECDAEGAQTIHRILNETVNPAFAGKFRTDAVEDGYKDYDIAIPAADIKEELDGIMVDMVSSDFFENTNKARFSKVMANAAESLVKAHAFPAKNDLTSVVFMTKMASEAGFELDWSKIPRSEFFQIARASIKGEAWGRDSLENSFSIMATHNKELQKEMVNKPDEHVQMTMKRFAAGNLSRLDENEHIGENGVSNDAKSRFAAKKLDRESAKPSGYDI